MLFLGISKGDEPGGFSETTVYNFLELLIVLLLQRTDIATGSRDLEWRAVRGQRTILFYRRSVSVMNNPVVKGMKMN